MNKICIELMLFIFYLRILKSKTTNTNLSGTANTIFGYKLLLDKEIRHFSKIGLFLGEKVDAVLTTYIT